MTQEEKLLISTVRAAVTDSGVCLEEVDWQVFFQLAHSHALAALACEGLQKHPDCWAQVPEPIQQYLTDAYMKAFYRDTQMEYRMTQLRQELTAAGVRHIFLKGAVLKYDYPVPALRTMSDLDVLVYTDDYDKIGEIANRLGGKAGHSDGNHRNYSFPGKVTVEFHPNLLHHSIPVGTQVNPGWQYAKKDSNSCAMELTEEGVYLNTICHLANHFVSGGVGVRFVLDVWVSRHLRKTQPDRTFVEQELSRFGLLEFTRNIEALAEAWFSEGELTPLLEELGDYILTSGSHGISERAMLNAVSIAGGRSSALLGKMFYSRAEMEDRFPWCKGKPWLLPAAWCVRAYRAVTRHGDLILKWGKETGAFSNEQASAQKEMLARFGIKPQKDKKKP